MDAGGSSYEVRCPVCDVSFPVETRRCIHCGGPTAASGAVVGFGAGGASPWSGSSGNGEAAVDPAAPPDRFARPGGLEPSTEPPRGVGLALLRSFGSAFWIIAVIGFSIARSCSEG
jgi:hypothetical protein